MNEIKHHLTDALLMAYSAGTLPEGFNLVVATHISLCDECRARMHEFDAVGGSVLDGETVAELSADSLEAVMRLIDTDAPREAPIAMRTAGDNIFPKPLQDYVGGDLDAVKWRKAGGGVRQAVLKIGRNASVRLLHIPAGTAMPDHGHGGMELTMVLQGAFRDDDDRFGVGDIEVATEDLHHKPVAELGADCICLAATDAPLRFKGWIPRIAQPFLGI